MSFETFASEEHSISESGERYCQRSVGFEDDSVVAYDIASTIDKLTGEVGVVKRTLKKIAGVDGNIGGTTSGSIGNDSEDSTSLSSGTLLTTIPILGSFQEGFYDPLTAKPRRLPLEIVQYDRLSKTAKLSYSSAGNDGVGSSIRATEQKSGKQPTLLTFDIPGLVAMNHPDKNLNGASSEFFCLMEKNRRPESTRLLDGE